MDASMLVGIVAIGSGFVFVFMLALFIADGLRHRILILKAQDRRINLTNLIRYRIETGFSCLLPFVRCLSRIPAVLGVGERLQRVAESRNLHTTCESVLTVLLAADTVAFFVFWVLSGSIVAGVVGALCVAAVVVVVSHSASDREKDSMRQEIPAALELMGACLSSGFTLMQTFQQISSEMQGSIGRLFGRSAHALEIGESTTDVLAHLQDESDISELSFVVAALEIQHESGGSLKQVLASASKSVKSELALRRSLQVQTAQAKLSARIVTLMPFILIALFCVVSPDFLQPFFSSVAGYGLLIVALLMEAAGIILVQRALTIDGVS